MCRSCRVHYLTMYTQELTVSTVTGHLPSGRKGMKARLCAHALGHFVTEDEARLWRQTVHRAHHVLTGTRQSKSEA